MKRLFFLATHEQLVRGDLAGKQNLTQIKSTFMMMRNVGNPHMSITVTSQDSNSEIARGADLQAQNTLRRTTFRARGSASFDVFV